MRVGKILTTAKSKPVVQDAALRGLGTAVIGAGLMAFQSGATLEEKALGALVMGLGLGIYIIKDVLNNMCDAPPVAEASLKKAGKKKK